MKLREQGENARKEWWEKGLPALTSLGFVLQLCVRETGSKWECSFENESKI